MPVSRRRRARARSNPRRRSVITISDSKTTPISTHRRPGDGGCFFADGGGQAGGLGIWARRAPLDLASGIALVRPCFLRFRGEDGHLQGPADGEAKTLVQRDGGEIVAEHVKEGLLSAVEHP